MLCKNLRDFNRSNEIIKFASLLNQIVNTALFILNCAGDLQFSAVERSRPPNHLLLDVFYCRSPRSLCPLGIQVTLFVATSFNLQFN